MMSDATENPSKAAKLGGQAEAFGRSTCRALGSNPRGVSSREKVRKGEVKVVGHEFNSQHPEEFNKH